MLFAHADEHCSDVSRSDRFLRLLRTVPRNDKNREVHPHPDYFGLGIAEFEISALSAIVGSVTYFSLARSSSHSRRKE